MYNLKYVPLDVYSLNWIITTQLLLYKYINEFNTKFFLKTRTEVEEQKLANLQAQYLKRIIPDIPNTDYSIKELLTLKILETFALHNRKLSEIWVNSSTPNEFLLSKTLTSQPLVG